jgi:hypothetical protein
MSVASSALPEKAKETLQNSLKEFAGSWASYSALGSFALYVIGYLALRFHLTVLGVGTDLAVLDERYLFTGAKFLVYLGSAIPIVVILALILALLIAAPVWLLARNKSVRSAWKKLRDWMAHPSRMALLGVVISILMIQFVMRQCFGLSNLLLADCLPPPGWMRRLLLAETGGGQSAYFGALISGLLIAAGLLYVARRHKTQTARSRVLTALLAGLVAIQFLLLPVNYGVLILDKRLPRVSDLGGVEQLKDGEEAWLVWEGKEGMTWLVRGRDANGVTRKLVTLPQKEVKKTQIIRYDPPAQVLAATSCEIPQ